MMSGELVYFLAPLVHPYCTDSDDLWITGLLSRLSSFPCNVQTVMMSGELVYFLAPLVTRTVQTMMMSGELAYFVAPPVHPYCTDNDDVWRTGLLPCSSSTPVLYRL